MTRPGRPGAPGGATARAPARRREAARRRLALLAAALAGTVGLAATDASHAFVTRLVAAVEGIAGAHPVLGGGVFVLLAALSAMLFFLSSTLLVPVGVMAWGAPTCALLLWTGWWLGGLASFAIGWRWGRRVAGWFVPPERLAPYEARAAAGASFGLIVLFQLALPSEVPGYVLGTVHASPARYLAALALAELPYAVGTVLLGAGFLDRRYALMAGLGLAAVVLAAWALHRLDRAMARRR